MPEGRLLGEQQTEENHCLTHTRTSLQEIPFPCSNLGCCFKAGYLSFDSKWNISVPLLW